MQKYKKFKNNPIFSIYFFYITKKEREIICFSKKIYPWIIIKNEDVSKTQEKRAETPNCT